MTSQFPHQRTLRDLHSVGGSTVAQLSRLDLVAPIIMILTMLCLTFSSSAQAEPSFFMKKSDVRSGTLLLQSVQEGQYVQAPLVGSDIDISVSGATARTRVTQHFYNPTDGWVEGVYVFPLPENSGVDSLKMVIGKRVIVGEIKEKQQAKAIYEQAKAEGKKASLMEQERPNVFTNSVANIGPHETVIIQMEYQQTVAQASGQFSLRVPLVVAPRYTPAPTLQTVDLGGKGWAETSNSAPDRTRIEAPILDPRAAPPANPVSLTVHLNAGFPIGEVKSHHHEIETSGNDDTRIVKIKGQVPADQDFELTWKPKSGFTPAAGLFHERLGASDYLLAFVTPPTSQQTAKPRAREIIFVIDNSGSMGGTSIGQAKASLQFGLDHLAPSDSFNIVRFDDTLEVLYPAAVSADGEHIAKAKAFVSSLDARGGTEMVPAMRAALNDGGAGKSEALRQVVFLTDGAIGNEQQLFDAIVSGLGRSRIFMIGIGSAPNTYLMSRAAELGRGSFTHIGSSTQVEDRMRELFTKLERPAVTDISVSFSESGADITPKVLPDLYAGETLQIAAKVVKLGGTVEIRGRIGDQPWGTKLQAAQAADGKGLSKVWARAKVDDAEVGVRLGTLTQAEADKRILALALEHSLLSRLTSLVAVDKAISRPADAQLSRADMPLNLPAGWDFDKVFGEHSSTENSTDSDANGEVQLIDAKYTQAIAATHQPKNANLRAAQSQAGVPLPETATDAQVHLRVGALLLSLGLMLLWRTRRHAATGQE
jgi:Ca-activated chloride channel homolog